MLLFLQNAIMASMPVFQVKWQFHIQITIWRPGQGWTSGRDYETYLGKLKMPPNGINRFPFFEICFFKIPRFGYILWRVVCRHSAGEHVWEIYGCDMGQHTNHSLWCCSYMRAVLVTIVLFSTSFYYDTSYEIRINLFLIKRLCFNLT